MSINDDKNDENKLEKDKKEECGRFLGSTGSHVEGRNVKYNWIQHEEKVTVFFYLRRATPAEGATGSLREGGVLAGTLRGGWCRWGRLLYTDHSLCSTVTVA